MLLEIYACHLGYFRLVLDAIWLEEALVTYVMLASSSSSRMQKKTGFDKKQMQRRLW